MSHHEFVTVNRGLNRHLPPMRLYEKAKKLGGWNPRDFDFNQDARDWAALKAVEQELLLHLTSMFQGGEEAVTVDLLPLILLQKRVERLEKARGASLSETYRVTNQTIDTRNG